MGYIQWWKALENLIMELRKKAVHIPPDLMTSLRSAKTLISVYQSDPSCVETIPTIEINLMNVESDLMNLTKEKVSEEFTVKWIKKLEEERKKAESNSDVQPRFVPSTSKDVHWVRVQPSEGLQEENIKQLANQMELSTRPQEDGYIMVYGDKVKVKTFIKKIADQIRKTSKK